MIKKLVKSLMFLPLLTLICSCTTTGTIAKRRTISRQYTLKNGHASFNEDDFGDTEYISKILNGEVTTELHCNFDSFYYFESKTSQEALYHKGFSDYFSTDESSTYFRFHYSENDLDEYGFCECKITSLNNEILVEKSGTYKFINTDDIEITYSDNASQIVKTRFGLEHNGIGKDKITYLQAAFDLNIDGITKTIYFWFYDSILHNSPWGEK